MNGDMKLEPADFLSIFTMHQCIHTQIHTHWMFALLVCWFFRSKESVDCEMIACFQLLRKNETKCSVEAHPKFQMKEKAMDSMIHCVEHLHVIFKTNK